MRRKIGFFICSFSIGGAERQLGYLINNLNRDLFDIHVIQISHWSSRPEGTVYPGAHVETFVMKSRLDIGVLFRISRYVRHNRIELIQSYLFLDNLIAVAVGFLSRRPVVTSVRGDLTMGKVRDCLETASRLLARKVVVNSNWLKELLIKKGVAPGKIVVIHNGIDPKKFQSSADKAALREKHGIVPGARVLGIVARFHPMKDHRTFFKTVKAVRDRMPDIQAVVVGYGQLGAELERYVDEIGIRGNVRFLGKAALDLPDVLRIMDVFLLTSRWGESLPNVLLEAMSAGVPVVAVNMHGVPEIVEDNVNGFLVDIGDYPAMADRVITLLTDDATRGRFIAKGLEKTEGFSIPSMAHKYEELYRTILSA